MNFSRKSSITALLLGAFAPSTAAAQDPTPTLVKPNVLLVVDSSGSMEYKTGEQTGDPNNYPSCTPNSPGGTNEKSRWIEVVEVLSGTIKDYSCEEMDRSSTNFRSEFQLPDGSDSPDVNYRNPHHRALSYGCAITPDRGTSPTNAFEWVPPLEAAYPVSSSSPIACSSSFDQDGNGFIDAYDRLVRFGLMTFDTDTDDDRGYSTSTYTPSFGNGAAGTWSYFSSTGAQGKPADCASLQMMEVGVRNGAAPPSEGKMIHFGDPNSDDTADLARHDRIQKVLLSTRPYGATPLNGALSDARHFFWEDSAFDPLDAPAPSLRFSPRYDEFVECGCREQHIILITDGEPNLDLRPDCEQLGSVGDDGVCPYPDDPEEILGDLYGQSTAPQTCASPATGTNKYRIATHVVGYSTDTYAGGASNCEDLKSDVPDWNIPGGTCDTTSDEDLRICCTLHELASAGSGGTEEPHIAPNSAALQSALGSIISSIVNRSASATAPVRSPGVGRADGSMAAFRLLTSYETDAGTSGLWRGNIERVRWTCGSSGTPELQPKDESVGDDFSHNTALNSSSRQFVTYVPDAISGVIHPDRSIRPYLASGGDDGAGNTSGTRTIGTGTSFANAIDPDALGITGAESFCVGASTPTNCRDRVMSWTIGFDDGASPSNNRCTSSGDRANCSVIGDVMHSSPVIVDRPTATLDDHSYDTFKDTFDGRTMMAYVSSNDGMVHGFRASPNDLAQSSVVNTPGLNENFAFLPPAVLSNLTSQYPDVRMKLLDGTASVQDVVATGTNFPYLYERSATSSLAADNTWRTVLVQSFGGAQSGYFAIDITETTRPSESGGQGGPRFLWQLTTTDVPDKLFGQGGTPIITSVNIGGIETAVAVLPGGEGGTPSGPCPRQDTAIGSGDYSNTHFDNTITGAPFIPRANVHCYDPAELAARSLTIVRLDSGEIIRTFRNSNTDVAGITKTTVYGDSYSLLDAPITGIPAAYPVGAGQVSDRVFVGDQDGTLWRVDVSNQDPAKWEMKLFFDAFAGHTDPDDSKPISTAPVLSVDDRGQITVAFGTGAQDLSGGSGDTHYIYSLTEIEDGNRFVAGVNWRQTLEDGQHLLGDMNLLGGNLFFSTIDPSASNACTPAPANIWGVHYIDPLDDSNPLLGGAKGLSPDPDPAGQGSYQFIAADQLIADNGGSGNAGAVFGVSVEFQPTCADTSTGDTSVTGGTRKGVSGPSASKMQLVFQTASATTSSDTLGFTTGFQAVALAQPKTASTIHSWAAILDN